MNNPGNIPPAHAAPPMDAPHPAVALARQIDVILNTLLMIIAAHFRILGARTAPVWNRISRARQRLVRLLANLAAGRFPRFRTARAHTPRPGRKGDPNALHLPSGHAWLVAIIGYHAAGVGSQLNHLLQDPATAALLAQSPGATRTMRRLCHLLGIPVPAALAPPKRPTVQPAAPPPDPPPATAAPRAPSPRARRNPQRDRDDLRVLPPFEMIFRPL